jgi:hypothetical protein
MYSNSNFLRNNIIRLVEINGKKTLCVCLVEDRSYSRNEFEYHSQEVQTLDIKPDKVFDLISKFLQQIKNAIKNSIKILYKKQIPFDISLPKIQEDKINPGEFVGNFIISRNPLIVLYIEPKIGWNAYSKMLKETRESIDVIISETGVLEPLIGNLYYPSLTTPISYSILLIKLTELVLSSTPPKKTMKTEVIAEDIIGKPIISKTLKYMLQGIPFGVYERIRIEPHDFPFMLLAKFHYELTSILENIVNNIKELIKVQDLLFFALRSIDVLRETHLIYLSMSSLSEAFQILQHKEIPDQELIDETRRVSQVNPYLKLLADLYEAYIHNIGLVYEQIERGVIVPMASSKIYELWILTRVTDYLRKIKKSRISVREYRDLYINLQLDDLQLTYNRPQPDPFVRKLTKSYLRPDFLFKKDNEILVYDAKYKERVSRDDIIELLAYITEFATPIGRMEKNTLIGGFYKLKGDVTKLAEREIFPLKIKLHLYDIDPRMNDNEIEANIGNSLQILIGN